MKTILHKCAFIICLLFASLAFSGCEALSGKDGSDGTDGAKGETGEQGITGEQATSGMPCAACVDGPSIGDGEINARTLATDAVTTDKIQDGAVTTGKIADLTVDSAELRDFNVTSAKIADNAVGSAEIGDGFITGDKTGNTVIDGTHLASGNTAAVTSDKIALNAVGTNQIQSSSVYENHIIAGELNRIRTIHNNSQIKFSTDSILIETVITPRAGAYYLILFNGSFSSNWQRGNDLSIQLYINYQYKMQQMVFSPTHSIQYHGGCWDDPYLQHYHDNSAVLTLGNVSLTWAGIFNTSNNVNIIIYADENSTGIEYSANPSDGWADYHNDSDMILTIIEFNRAGTLP